MIPPLNGHKCPRERGINDKAFALLENPEIRTSSLRYAHHCFVTNITITLTKNIIVKFLC